ncbi:MAG: hypothetical protein U0R49_08340 [Fimbriimonadales bacterium]
MRSKNILAVLVAAALVMIAVGCGGGGNKLAGKWNVTGIKNMPPGATTTMNFDSGDKMDMVMEMTNPAGAGKIKITVMTTYTLSGDTMTIKANDAKFEFPGVEENVKKMMEQGMEGAKAKMLEDIGKGSGKLKWEGDNKVTITGTDGTATLERAK